LQSDLPQHIGIQSCQSEILIPTACKFWSLRELKQHGQSTSW
jgi:hypothetical protein